MNDRSCCLSRPISSSLHPEKAPHCRYGAGRVLFFGRVAEILEHHERAAGDLAVEAFGILGRDQPVAPAPEDQRRDRKSTRLNSSHVKISYAVFCLKKKKKK